MRPNLLIVAVAFVVGCAVLLALILVDKQTPDYERVETTSETTSTLPASFNEFLWGKAEAEYEADQSAKARASAALRKKRMQTASKPRVMRGQWPWDALAECESGGDWSNDSYHDGGLQFHPKTWTRYGGGAFAPYAWGATREQQISIAERVLASEGWGAWPTCSRKLGLR